MQRRKYFFLLSGEYETLPLAELRSVLRILDPMCKIAETSSGRVVIAETFEEAAKNAVERAAYTKLCCLLGSRTETREETILESVNEKLLEDILPSNASNFAVRGKRICGVQIDRLKLEKAIGSKVLKLKPHLKVNLESPQVTLFFLSDLEETFIGRLVHAKPKHFFSNRIAGKRPFILPSAMQPDFSRAMVNLAEVEPGGRILDPFAGTGGIMIEAGLLGYEIYGVEFKDWIAEGGLRNLKKYIPGEDFMIVGDARALMFREEAFHAIVTDPPYGRSTTIPDRSIADLLAKFFTECKRILRKKGRIVMAVPLEIDLEEIVNGHGLRILQTHFAKVHGSLVRKVVVLET